MKPLAFILSFIILFNAVVPCSIIDNCAEEEVLATCCDSDCSQEEETGEEKEPVEEKDCNDCPPFSICSTVYAFSPVNNYNTQQLLQPGAPIEFFEKYISYQPGYYSKPFQPPRLG